MKQNYFKLFSTCAIIILAFSFKGFSQEQKGSWTAQFEYPKAFIENKGQFPVSPETKISKDEILFAVDNGPTKIYFTKDGVIYDFLKAKKHEENDIENVEEKRANNFEEWEEREGKNKPKEYDRDEVSISWENSNPEVKVIAEDLRSDYYSYSLTENGKIKNVNFIKGYKKIIYKNLYKNIDVEYTFHPVEGIKYALILHPGADVSKIKMTYSGPLTLSSAGDLHISTIFGDLIDHAPETFYTGNTSLSINSYFTVSGNSVGFVLDSYDKTKSITIDPWVVTPAFTTSTAVWEVETDGFGDVYVIGGETPMQLKKYTSAGNLRWTYTTPWDTASVWLGTLATDNVGNSFITSGTAPEMERIDSAGTMIWHHNGSAMDDEWWSITFNCDKTKLIVGGTKLNMLAFEAYATIFNIDITNGNVLGSQNLAYTNLMGFGTTPVEVRSISSSKNAKYIFLTHNDVGAINQNIGACPNSQPVFQVNNGHNLSYKCENYLPATQNGGGLKALVANDQFLYTHGGDKIYKRSLANGALISSATIPGGSNATDFFGKIVVHNSGLAVDNCGNVYAGSANQVIKFDANLNILDQAAVSFTVYDVSVNSNGEVVAVGAQSDNSATNRNGRIQSVNLSACPQFALVCCDANICHVDTVCSTDPAFNIISTSTGGTWSGTGITNTSTGTFDPSVSGPGTFTVTYTLACGSDSVHVVVNDCANLIVCQEANGSLTVSGGTAPYTWQQWVQGSPTPITNQAQCQACGYTWIVFQCMDGSMNPVSTCPGVPSWSTFTTGTTATLPAGADTIKVIDFYNNELTINDTSTLPPCSGCPTITVSASNIINTCAGFSNGSFSASAGGGTSPYDYTLVNGIGTTVATYNNVTGSQNFSGLPASNYTLNVLDSNNCPGTTSVIITVLPAPTADAGTNQTICSGNSATLTATGGGTYAWSTTASAASITVTPGSTSTYTVTVTGVNGCTASDNVMVTVTSALVADAGTNQSICTGATATLTANGGQAYSWSNGGSTASITVSPAGTTTYTVTVSSGSCIPATDDVTITVNPIPVTSAVPSVVTICSGNSVTLTAGGATSYSWSPSTGLNTTSGTTVIANPTSNVTYTVTGSSLGCSSTASVAVTVIPGVTANAGTDVSICTGNSTTLTASGGTSYSWSSSATTASITVTPSSTATYTVTVSNGACSGTDAVIVTVNNIPAAAITGDTLVCTGTSTILTASGGSTYLWNTTDTAQSISVTPFSMTSYTVTVSNGGCTSTASITVNMVTPSSANAGNDTTINIGGSAQLSGSGGIGFSWSPALTLSCSNCADPVASPTSTTTYILVVTDTNGCTSRDTVVVTVDVNCGEVFVPNAFSPNKDGQNEMECVYGNCIQILEFVIYDRWGNKVFETTDPKKCWDGMYKGKLLNTGVFVYYIKTTLYNGTVVNKSGNINLIR